MKKDKISQYSKAWKEEDFTSEFRSIRRQVLINPELATVLSQGPSQDDHMIFGAGKDPYNVDVNMAAHIADALDRKFYCRECQKQTTGNYKIVHHSKTLLFVPVPIGLEPKETKRRHEQNTQLKAKFGTRKRSVFHVGVYCPSCKNRIQFVRYSEANRRAAKDFLLLNERERKFAPAYVEKGQN